ncbi:hypothetical protein FOA52_004260 [Chlamydomonas sp. UWO 241]|nr:hypothetical protein FOA52_004260 [Chlamydomonas sp. UWO 241]
MSRMLSTRASPLLRAQANVGRCNVFRPAASLSASHCASSVASTMFGLTCESTERSRRRVVASAKGAKGGKKGGGGGGDDDDKPSKGGKGGDKGGGNSVDELAKIEKQTKADMAERTQKSLTALADNLNTIRTGRASASILDRILVTMEGSTMPLKSVAQISVPDASTLLIMPFDKSLLRLIEKALTHTCAHTHTHTYAQTHARTQISVPDASTLLIMPFDKSSLRLIEKALNESDIGINPSNDGERIRLAIPSLTEERRTDLAKKVGTECACACVCVGGWVG